MSAAPTESPLRLREVSFDPFAQGEPGVDASSPTTDAQREIWSATRFGREANLAFNEANVLRLRGPLDASALRLALAELVSRHESLRATLSDDGSVLCVNPPGALDVPFEDLTGLGPSERTARLERVRADAVEVAFDLTRGPLFSARLLRLGEQEHALLLAAHHVICDGWSTRVIIEELKELYEAARRNASADLPAPYRFTEYAREQQDPARSSARAEDRAYWLERLGSGVPVLDLPTIGRRPAVRSYASRRLDFELCGDLVGRLKRVAASRGCSLFVALFSGFTAFLARLAGQDEVVVGVPAAGQSGLEGRGNLVGHCVQTLPIRCAFLPDEPFATAMSRQRGNVLDAFEHQSCTFGSLLEHLPVARDASRPPLVSVIFNLDQALPEQALRWDGLDVSFSSVPRQSENFELFVNAVERRGPVVLECQYNSDLFAEETLRRWLEGFAAFLDAAATDPQRAVGELPIVGPADAALLAGVNATDASFPCVCVHELVEAQVDRSPAAAAVEDAMGSVTYEELDRRANRLAHRLRSAGVARGDRVGLAVDRSKEMVIALLAILKAGGAYVPLDLGLPRARVAFVVSDAALKFIVVERARESSLPGHQSTVVHVDDDGLGAEGDARRLPVSERLSDPSEPAYVLYTSGSTGTPKGVEVPHRAVSNFLASMAREPGVSPSDVVMALTTLSFDIAVLELLLPLTVGARVFVATRSVATDGVALLSEIRARRVTIVQATPSTWRLLIAAGWSDTDKLKVLCGGEALPATLAAELLRRSDQVWNLYGPTETTVWSTLYRLPPSVAGASRVPIGRPLANTQVYVLDARLQPVPTGVRGELCIGGAGVARGYVRRDELTAARFVGVPGRPGTRVYRTGDVVRMHTDGTLEYLGRGDAQVKVRGHRIELGEVEAALTKHPKVGQAAATVIDRGDGDARLVAYVVPREGDAPREEELRSQAREWLPEAAVPQEFVFLDALPMTPNGKLDRNALPKPAEGRGDDASAYIAPRTPTERMLATAWQDALKLGRIGVTEDLFRLGAHSLLAAQVLARLAKQHGVSLPLIQVFQSPTIAELAEAWERAEATLRRRPREVVSGPGRSTRPRQSLMQQRLWFLEAMDPGLSVFNLPSAYRLTGPLDADVLERSLAAVVARHEALRTTLSVAGEVPVQIVAAAVTASIERLDLTHLPEAQREEEALRLAQREANLPFDLSRGPLFRASLYRLGPERHVFFFMPHHAIWDGWSFDIFMSELDVHYAAFTRGARPELSPLPFQYGDFAEWHLGWLQGPELARQSAFWTSRLAGSATALELPTDRPRPPRRTGKGGFEPFRLGSERASALVDVARLCGVTPYMLLLTAFATLLHRLTAQDDLIVGTPVRGRSQPDTENLVGFFVNTLALRLDASGSPTLRELLLRVRTTCIDAFAHPDMPFELLVRQLDVPRDLSRTPLFQAFFSYQDATARKDTLGDLAIRQLHVMPDAAPTDLTLWLMQKKDEMVGGLSYSTDLFEPASARRMLDELEVILSAIPAHLDRPISRVPVLSAAERALIRKCNDTRTEFERSATVPALLSRRASCHPHAIAVADETGAQLTYGELALRARSIAGKLRAMGVGRGARVGVCVERSAELPAVLLGVLEAGAAYVPLDPDFPEARLSFMASDAQLAVLVASGGLGEEVAPGVPRCTPESLASADLSAAPEAAAQPEDPAYVIYTSGSTGVPKGVVVPHRAVVNFLSSMSRTPGLAVDDVLVAVTTLSFDIAGLELFLPLVRGARVIVASRETAQNGGALLALLRRVGATVLQATPSTWRMLVEAGWSSADSLKVLCGGEALPLELARAISERATDAWNLYGPTETTIWSTAWRIPPAPDRVLIGRPIANTRCHVLDANGEEVPVGVAGELWIAGDGVTLGYLGRPEAMAERFVADPFAGDGSAMYRTGDLVRRLPSGDLECIGRNDGQIKLRGYRIELGEIENALGRHPAVAEVCAAVRTREGDGYLVAYFTLRTGQAVTNTELRKMLRAHLPEYMLPQAFVELRELPRTPNGKVDRKALPEPFGLERAAAGSVAPRTDNEHLVARVWCELIGRREVGVHDNFFDVGGHSLLVLKAILRIEQETGARLGPRSFVVDTLEQLAAQLPASRAPGAEETARESLGLFGRLRQRLLG